MTASIHEISVEELAEARIFFENSSQPHLELIANKFDEEQPYFSATGSAWKRMNIEQYAVKQLLQSVLEVYYVVTVLQEQKIKPIDISDIQKGVELFDNACRSYGSSSDSDKSFKGSNATLYFKNSAVFEHSIDTMNRAFGDVEAIVEHSESLVIYNALLRAIEIAE